MAVARELIAEHTHAEGLGLRHWRGGWLRWEGPRWIELEERAVRKGAYTATEHADYEDDKGNIKPWAPNRSKVGNLLEAVAAISHLPEATAQPTWLDGVDRGTIVACGNGLLQVDRRELLEHTPRYLNTTATPFDYDPDAPTPTRWLSFLRDLWGDDVDAIKALQEWCGYVISGRTDLHKILLLVGPTRGGKGAIARILSALIGKDNICGPTLSGLGNEFGLAPLLGKSLAVISDARLQGRGTSIVVERLLAISGEDLITVNRKYRDQWSGKLPARFMIISNELPQLGDASMAIAGRFVTLLLSRSWLGEEDHTLEPEMRKELPGILNWALDGLERLTEYDRFTQPSSADDAYKTLQDLASPVGAFVRDQCKLGPDHEIPVDRLWTAWREWAELNGHPNSTKQVLGKNLRAAHPGIRKSRLRRGEDREHVYTGITLTNGGWTR